MSLAPYTTLRIGGPARFFVSVRSEQNLVDALAFARDRACRVFVLGGGSNLVVPDEGFEGLVVHAAVGTEIRAVSDGQGTKLHVDAGVEWDDLVRYACERGLSGMECLAGIPGLVGGSPIQNIGAYGQEVASTIEKVRVFDRQARTFTSLSHEECGFSYRHSIFNSAQRDRYVVTQVSFFFAADARPNLSYADLRPIRDRHPSALEIYHFVRSVRDAKGMLVHPENLTSDSRSAGSFFKNPVVPEEVFERICKSLSEPPSTPITAKDVPHWPQRPGEVKLAAAWLIERAGFAKGYSMGAVGISSRHTLALINRSGSARAAELFELRDHLAGEVFQRFGVRLEQEPVILR